MRILIVAATLAEISPVIGRFSPLTVPATEASRTPESLACVNAVRDAPVPPNVLSRHGCSPDPLSFVHGAHAVHVLVTGVGMVATAVRSAAALAGGSYDLALNLGVCGAFPGKADIGSVVHVISDSLPELGAEDGNAFLDIHQLQLLGRDEPPFTDGRLVNPAPPASEVLHRLPQVHGITVNTVHGAAESITAVVARLRPDVESMEGAAFAYACLVRGIPFAQIRAVSNVVERRNRAAWRLGDAVQNLARTSLEIIATL